jgi:GrpB-like predicted nucleotidyltransferase (UPF0157 family)
MTHDPLIGDSQHALPSERRVLVVDYDSTWPLTFAILQAPISDALRGVALSVEHVGSTSVPGLAAKPIIDIDAVIPSRAELPGVIEKLASLGYAHRGTLGIEDREAFESPAHLPAHHLYACVQGSAALANHLAIRDHLRRNPAAVMAYGQLKKQLAAQFPTDINRYIAGKTDFLSRILQSAGFSDAVLVAIREANAVPP